MRDPKAIIYSDSDGVLADFNAGAVQVLGHRFDASHIPYNDRGILLNRQEKFWETLPLMKDALTYWNYIEKYHPDRKSVV